MIATLRRYLIAGLLVWAPLGITIFVIKLLVELIDRMEFVLPPAWRPESWLGFTIPGTGAIIGFLVVLLTGAIAANLIGRRMVLAWERFLARIPLVRAVYAPVKQVLTTLLSTGSQSFRRVLLIEFPRKGIWRLAFQTGHASDQMRSALGQELITVFVPSTPNPTSGFVVFMPESDVVEVDMRVDDAMKLIMSLGVLAPEQASPVAGETAGL